MSELSHATSVSALALALLTGDNQQPNIQGVLKAWLQLAQELEDNIWAVYESRLIALATGAQLDLLGRIVGALRNNLADADFRTAIKVQIAVNKSKGRAQDLVKICILAGASPTYVQTAPAHFQITLQDNVQPVAKALSHAKALGTSGDMISYPLNSNALIWDSVTGGTAPAGAKWDDVSDTLGDGKWCEVSLV